MWQILSGLLAGVIGAVTGSYVTWRLARRESSNGSRREVLASVARGLESYRIAYANWYVEYLSPGGDWRRIDPRTDPVYRERLLAVDTGRAALRVAIAEIRAHLTAAASGPLVEAIRELLAMTANDHRVDCREVDAISERTFALIPELIRRYV